MIIFYSKAKKNGKITKPKKVIADTKEAAMKFVKDNDPGGGDVMFFDDMSEYEKLMNDIKDEEERRRAEKLTLNENGKKIWEYLQDRWVGEIVLNEDAVDNWGLNKDTDKPYYIIYGWESCGTGHFATKEELVAILEKDIMGDWDEGNEKSIIEVSTLKKIKVLLEQVSFKYNGF